MSCTYGPSLNPTLNINIHVAASLLNMTYTQGYAPPPYVLANPNAYIPLTDQVTYTYGAGLNTFLSFPIQNTDVIQGDLPICSCHTAVRSRRLCAALRLYVCIPVLPEGTADDMGVSTSLEAICCLPEAACGRGGTSSAFACSAHAVLSLPGGRKSTVRVALHIQVACASQRCLAV